MNRKLLTLALTAALVWTPAYAESTDQKELWGANMDSTFAVTAVQDAYKNWNVHFVNSSSDTYNLTVQVEQYNAEQKRIGTKLISARLAPEQILDKPVKAADGTTSCVVKMRNWSKIEKKQSANEIEDKIETLKEEISKLEKQK